MRFGPALKAFLLCLLIGGSGVGYVWQKSQINELGKQILKRERRLGELREQNDKLRKQLAEMRLPRFLEMRIRDLKLGLAPAQPFQIRLLPEPSRETPAPRRPSEYAAEDGPRGKGP